MTPLAFRRCIVFLATCAAMVACSATTARAEELDERLEPRTRFSAAESLQLALDDLGAEASTLDVLRSLDEAASSEDATVHVLDERIVATARSFGVAARRADGLKLADLRGVDVALILRIRPAIDAETADHYVLMPGLDGENVRLAGSMQQELTVPISALAQLWDGHLIVLAKDEASLDEVRPASTRLAAAYISVGALGLVAVAGGAWLRRRPHAGAPPRHAPMPAQVVFLFIGATVLGGVAYLAGAADRIAVARAAGVSDSAMVVDFRDGATPVTAREARDLTAEDLRHALRTSDVLWVDSRTQEEYDRSHLRGAVCLPKFDAPTSRLRLAGVAPDRPIVVYCGNAACGRGRAAAAALSRAGFSHVSHFPPGWAELQGWKEVEVEHVTASAAGAARLR